LRAALKRISEESAGVIVLLRPQESPRDFMESVREIDVRANVPRPVPNTVLRTYGIGAQILKDLGINRMRVLSAPKQLQGLSAFDLHVTGYVSGDE
jgi:3,4-dihydroxy 2-butanone 4-phosphate synthase/GTP cyclohydrolase II